MSLNNAPASQETGKHKTNYLYTFYHLITNIGLRDGVAEGIALLGGILYFIQLWIYTHSLDSHLDEGAYLVKGYLYATGQYQLYQDYGFWSNKMPFSFLIPGFVQRIFGPGLDTGRYFAIFLALLMLLGVWILARRLGNRWWGAAVVWIVVVSPAIIKSYSLAVSQVLVSCMLVWTLVLVMGENRPNWQIGLGALLAGITAMTRINMSLIIPFILFYIFWEHGRVKGILATSITLLTILITHALYWPGILIMWARVIPRSLTPFLDVWRASLYVQDSWQPEPTAIDRMLSLFQGVRFHFAAIIGTLTSWLLWPGKHHWQSQSKYRAAVLLSVLFITQLIIHIYFALGQDYCVYCFSGYISFFTMVGLLLVVVSISSWKTRLPWWQQAGLVLLILLITTGIGLGAFEEIGNQLLDSNLLKIQIPRFLLEFPSFSTGSVPLEVILENKFNPDNAFLRKFASAMAGFLAGLVIIVIALGVKIFMTRSPSARKTNFEQPSYGYWLLVVFLLIGIILLPTKVMAGGQSAYNCSDDVIKSYQAIGEHLAENIPPESLIYWQGTDSTVPLLYIPGSRIFPPQMNGQYSLKENGDSDLLLRFGFWSQEIAQNWLQEADYVLIEESAYKGWLRDWINSREFEELEPTPPTPDCGGISRILIFKRIP